MLDLSRFEGDERYADLVSEIKKLREVGSRFAEIGEMINAESEPVRRDTVQCEEVCRRKAREALDLWRTLHADAPR